MDGLWDQFLWNERSKGWRQTLKKGAARQSTWLPKQLLKASWTRETCNRTRNDCAAVLVPLKAGVGVFLSHRIVRIEP
jgi:hypothetical protein